MKKNKEIHTFAKKIIISAIFLCSSGASFCGMQQAPAMIGGAISTAESKFDQLKNSLHAPTPPGANGMPMERPSFTPAPMMQRAPATFGMISPRSAFSPINNPPFALARPGMPMGANVNNQYTLPTQVSNQYGYGVENGN